MDEIEFLNELDKRDSGMREGTARGEESTPCDVKLGDSVEFSSSEPEFGVALTRVVRETEHAKIYSEQTKGPGGARHQYVVMARVQTAKPRRPAAEVCFQFGPISENGVNGCQNEDLLAIVADRLTDFQAGEFACAENAVALKCVKEAAYWLEERTRSRTRRGVEGKSEK